MVSANYVQYNGFMKSMENLKSLIKTHLSQVFYRRRNHMSPMVSEKIPRFLNHLFL